MRIGRLLPAASVTVLMAGCSPYWAASGDTFVEYSGSDRGKVQACADFSAQPEHQASDGMPLYIVVTDLNVESTDGVWEVTGTTVVVNEDDEYLDWSCRVAYDADSRSLHAELVNIGPGREVPLCGPTCSAPSQGSIDIELGDSYHTRSAVPCIDLAAAVASLPEQAGPVRATVRGDHDAPTRRFHGTLEVESHTAYQWSCELSKAYDPWVLDYELTAFEPL
jgi:hypothetical protein